MITDPNVQRLDLSNLSDEELDFIVTPNPSDGFSNLYIHAPESVQSETMEIILNDMLGRVVSKQKYKKANYLRLNFGSRSPGLYFITLRLGDNEKTKKIILH